jgi:thiamine transport system substrate-binding protein
MKHFVAFLVCIFSVLFFLYFNREDRTKLNDDRIIRVFASSAFVSKQGPAAELKELFEIQSLYKVEFIESPDMGIALQKIGFENQNSIADVVLGIDQFDISRMGSKVKWQKFSKDLNSTLATELVRNSDAIKDQNFFIPYEWSPMTFVTRQDLSVGIGQLEDLLKPELKGKIALQDPKVSAQGLQFLAWIFDTRSESEAIRFLKTLLKQDYSFTSSWTLAHDLFINRQVDSIFSYVTTPVSQQFDEKHGSYVALELKEALPIQAEFAAIPSTCKNCEGAEKFVEFIISKDAQKLIMSKNAMFPVIDHVKESTVYDSIKIYKTKPVRFYEQEKIEKWLNHWTEIRKSENP